MAKPKLIFLVTEDWYFYSHRLPMARAAMAAGYDVAVATNVGQHRALIEAENIRVLPFPLDRRSLNPFRALMHICKLAALYRREKPCVAHHIAMKPVMYGAIAARMARVPNVVNAFAGLGYLFTAQDSRAKFLRAFLVPVFRVILRGRGSVLLLQNRDDRALLEGLRIAGGRTVIIRGSGVDLDHCRALPLPAGDNPFICAFAGRMIDIKGLPTLKEAFEILAKSHPHIHLWLCGKPDDANPGSWDAGALSEWAQAPNVDYKGHCADMREVWAQAHIALQASWGGEGIPKSLLEAAACARPIVATDVPGCREVVEDGINGFLVPPRNAQALAAAIAQIAESRAGLEQMANASRVMVESDLSATEVSRQIEALYRSFACG